MKKEKRKWKETQEKKNKTSYVTIHLCVSRDVISDVNMFDHWFQQLQTLHHKIDVVCQCIFSCLKLSVLLSNSVEEFLYDFHW